MLTFISRVVSRGDVIILWVTSRYRIFWSDAAATIFFLLLVFVWLLFKGSICFFEKPADTNNGWTRYVRVMQWQLLNTISSTRSFSVMLSALERDFTTRTGSASLLTVTLTCCECAAYTVAFISLRTSECAATIQGWHLFEEILCLHKKKLYYLRSLL